MKADYIQAIHHYERLLHLAQDTAHLQMLSVAHSGLADSYLAQGDTRQALDQALRARQAAQDTGSAFARGLSARALGDVYLRLQDTRQAAVLFEESIPLLEGAKEEAELMKARQGRELAVSRLNANPPFKSATGE